MGDPRSAVSNASKNAKSLLLRSLVKDYDLIAFIDGAWKRIRLDQGNRDIGGLLISNNMQLKFISSEPSQGISI